MKRLFIKLLVSLFLGCLAANVVDCAQSVKSNIAEPSGPQKITWAADTLPLLWDPPHEAPFTNMVVSYDIFYRKHGTSDSTWIILHEGLNSSSQPKFVVLRSATGNGEFDFATCAVYPDSGKSNYLSSLDSTSYHPAGWYLSW
jgi:hypothetical protein